MDGYISRLEEVAGRTEAQEAAAARERRRSATLGGHPPRLARAIADCAMVRPHYSQMWPSQPLIGWCSGLLHELLLKQNAEQQ